MQITTLNKIINIFLIGAFAFTLLLFPLYFYYSHDLSRSDVFFTKLNDLITKLGPTATPLITALTLISVPILLGVVIDAAANIIFENIVEKLPPSNEKVRKFFGIKWRYDQCNELFVKCLNELDSSDKYKHLAKDKTLIRSYAVAFFLHTANKENIEWVIQHYSYYLLSINYLFIICLTFIFTIFLPFALGTKIIICSVSVIFIYLLMSQAMTKFLYSYECAYRHWSVILAQESEEKSKTAKPRTSQKANLPN